MTDAQKRFDYLCGEMLYTDRPRPGIGTLQEKSLHAVLKVFFEPDTACHEIKCEGYVADILHTDNRITEIQTASVYPMKKKLEAFLPSHPVTLVCPVAGEKKLIWVIPETGELLPPRKSPKKGRPSDLFRELSYITEYLGHPNLTLCVPQITLTEYRLKNGWGRDGKRGSTRYERYPEHLEALYFYHTTEDYLRLLPDGLPPLFGVSELKRAAGLSPQGAACGIRMLCKMGVLSRAGKDGQRYLYKTEKE